MARKNKRKKTDRKKYIKKNNLNLCIVCEKVYTADKDKLIEEIKKQYGDEEIDFINEKVKEGLANRKKK